MLFIVQFEDVYADQPERLPERELHLPAHLAFLAEHAEQVVAAGALRSSPYAVPSRGIWLVNAENKQSVESFYKDGPFWKAGLVSGIHTLHERIECRLNFLRPVGHFRFQIGLFKSAECRRPPFDAGPCGSRPACNLPVHAPQGPALEAHDEY